MAIKTAGRAKSLAVTGVGSSPTTPIGAIQSYSNSRSQELADFLKGTARVVTHYGGTKSASITIETADIGAVSTYEVGMKLDNVILTLEGAKDSADVADGSDLTLTLSEAVVSEISELGGGNENNAPATQSITFTLSRHADSSADPTFTIAVVSGGGGGG